MLIKSLNFNVCVCTFIGGAKGGRGGCRGSFINRAVVVTELFSLSNLNFKLLKQNKYTWATIVGYVFQNYCLCKGPFTQVIFVVATRCNFCCA